MAALVRLLPSLVLALALSAPGAAVASPPATATYILHLSGKPTNARVDRALSTVPGSRPDVKLSLIDAVTVQATPAEAQALAHAPGVERVERDRPATTFDTSADAGFGTARARAQLPGIDGSGMVAAVIDSGIDAKHPDLTGKVIGWKDLVADKPEPYDDFGHGTWVSGILAGRGVASADDGGVAPGATLVGVKVIDSLGQSSLAAIAQGIQWAVDHKDEFSIDAINLSIGDPSRCGTGQDAASLAVQAAVDAGIVVVAAAGNSGPQPCTVADPGAAAAALTVGAMSDPGAGGFVLDWFSSRGPTADKRTKPDVVAPGFDVTGPDANTTGVRAGGGTSAAAPFTTGLTLLMLEQSPGLAPAEVKTLIRSTADEWGTGGPDNDYGAGRLDGYAALHAAGAALATPPPVPEHKRIGGFLDETGAEFYSGVEIDNGDVPLAATLLGDGVNVDLDVLDAEGNVVATATRRTHQEDVTIPAPAPGNYRFRVRSGSGSGDFSLDLSGAFSPTDEWAPGLTLTTPADGASLATGTPQLAGAAGTDLGDFPGIVVRIRRAGEAGDVRVLRVTPALGTWSADVTPALPDGSYVATAEQGDASGNTTVTPEVAFAVDTQAPAAPVITEPAEGRALAAHTVMLTGTAEPGTTVEVTEGAASRGSVVAGSGGAWGVAVLGAGEGVHHYVARATDAAGNASPSSAARTVRIDTTAPDTSLTGGPPAVTTARTAQFALSGTEAGTFECRVDAHAWAPCTSPVRLSALGLGTHTFSARATDQAGNVDPTPASRRWRVDAPAAAPTPTSTPSGSDHPQDTAVEPAAASPGPLATAVRSLSAGKGVVLRGRAADLRRADKHAVTLAARSGRATLVVDLDAVASPADVLRVTSRLSASARCAMTLQAWSWTQHRWVTLAARDGRRASLSGSGPAARFVRDGRLRLRVGFVRSPGPLRARIDLLRAVVATD